MVSKQRTGYRCDTNTTFNILCLSSGALYTSQSTDVQLFGNSVFDNNLAGIDGGEERFQVDVSSLFFVAWPLGVASACPRCPVALKCLQLGGTFSF